MSHLRTSPLHGILLAGAMLAASCGGDDGDSPEGCESPLVTGTTFSAPQAAGDRSFQAHATFDGQAVWLTHATAVAADRSMRIRALRIQCDGTVSSEEVRVEDQSGLQTEPRITSHDGDVMLAWQLDDQVSKTNLHTYYKIFDRDGDPALAPAIRLDTEYGGAPAGNTWMPELDASEAGFVVAGLRGVEGYQSFQAFAQRIGKDGSRVGEAINAQLSDELVQNMATVSQGDDGSLVLGWTRESDNELPHAVHVRVEAEQSEPANEPIRICADECSMVSLGGSERYGQYLAVAEPDGTLSIKASTLFNVEAPMLRVGAPGPGAIYPTIASGAEGAAVAWLVPTAGFNSEIHVQAFRGEGYEIELVGSEQLISTNNPAIGPYRLSLIHIQDAAYMLAWTEGPTDSLQVKWRFLDLSPES